MKTVTLIRRLVALLFWIFLLVDLVAWAGLSRQPRIGPAVLKSVQQEGVFSRLYLEAGRPLVAAAGLEDYAVAFAERRFAEAIAPVAENPAAAMDIIGQDMGWLIRLTHNGAPVLAVGWLILWWRRPRILHLTQRR